MIAPSAEPLVLDVSGLTVEYRDAVRTVRAVTGLSLSVARGRTVALIGESGSGKTTAALAILGMLPGSATVLSGSVAVTPAGRRLDLLRLPRRELRALRWQHIAYVPQGSISSLNPIQRIGRHFQQTAEAHALGRRAAEARAMELLAAVHLEPRRIWTSYPHELSGGTRQRVAIALAMLLEPEVIVLDEPTTALDVLTQEAVLTTLLELQAATGVSYLAITHDLSVAGAVADEVITMYAGRAVERGTAEQVLADPLHPYTAGLLRSTPSVDSDLPVQSIGGHPPSLSDLPPGCSFHPRCGLADERCRSGGPPALLPADSRTVACHRVSERVAAGGPG
ncbi:ABC transporter ATP-binding protein [Jiangella anatolica]|uniref:Nickel import system ATP-binding protein NikD n=1 Tax=Jiangella anatolica TaxID=2670374 RepID=A0A2W2D2I7_9ACTN|nr:ABC transporter ATP-binding protein [Jiangella anatolica]PZF86733.1 dipeptide/oligopeptide/nickel ABC transporter ATP-binding protein [Jiangella anatolica]